MDLGPTGRSALVTGALVTIDGGAPVRGPDLRAALGTHLAPAAMPARSPGRPRERG